MKTNGYYISALLPCFMTGAAYISQVYRLFGCMIHPGDIIAQVLNYLMQALDWPFFLFNKRFPV